MAKLKFKKRIVPDAGKHIATLVQVEEVDNKFFNPAKDSADRKTQLEWTFVYDKQNDMRLRTWSTMSLSIYKGRKSKALKIIEALLDKTLTDEEKETFRDTDEVIGKRYVLEVEHEKNDDGETVAKITEFEPLKEGANLPF